MDRKVISIRADETSQRDLKFLANLKQLSVGEVFESLVREEMRRMRRGRLLFKLKEKDEELDAAEEKLRAITDKVELKQPDRNRQKKKKRR